MNLINLEYKKDIITVDLRNKQIRYLTNLHKLGNLKFVDMSNDDVEGYRYLYANSKDMFLISLIEDIESFTGIVLDIDFLKVV